MNASTAASLIAARTNQGSRAGIIDPAIPLGGRAFTVRTEIAGTGSATVHQAVVRLTDQPLQPYWVLSWKTK